MMRRTSTPPPRRRPRHLLVLSTATLLADHLFGRCGRVGHHWCAAAAAAAPSTSPSFPSSLSSCFVVADVRRPGRTPIPSHGRPFRRIASYSSRGASSPPQSPSPPRWRQRRSPRSTFARCATPSSAGDDTPGDGGEDDELLTSFRPAFDGQLYYGLPSDGDGRVTTTVADIRARVGMDELEEIGGGVGGGGGGVDDADRLLITSPDGMAATKKRGGGEDAIAPCHERLLLRPRERVRIRDVPCVSRTVPITPSLEITVYEMEKPSELVRRWMERHDDPSRAGDPFGVVMWPGSIQASRELIRRRGEVENSTVLVLGAGSGVEAQVAASLGARRVIATDVNTFTLELLRHGAEAAGCGDVVETRVFDFADEDRPLLLLKDKVDIVVMSDVLYNERLAGAVRERCREVLDAGPPRRPALIVTDSQRFHGTDFLRQLNRERAVEGGAALLEWEEVTLGNVTGSGILIEGDQTYDVKVRMLSLDGGVRDAGEDHAR